MGALAEGEQIPQQLTYKILKKLSGAGLIHVARGAEGGCRLLADLSRISLYDVMAAVNDGSGVSACTAPGHQCPWRAEHGGCAIHCRLMEIQRQLNEALSAYSLQEILALQ